MLRLISILLLLGGMLVAGVGVMALLDDADAPRIVAQSPVEMAVDTPPPPEVIAEEAPIVVEADPVEVAVPPGPDPIIEDTPPKAAAMPAQPKPGAAQSMQTRTGEGETAPEPKAFETAAMPPAVSEVVEFTDDMTEDEIIAIIENLPPTAAGTSAPQTETGPTARERFMETLKTVPVAHETPTNASYKKPFNVTLAIDATGDDSAADALPGRGVVVTGEAQVSDRVEARIAGSAFLIEPQSPPIQDLSPLTENTWRWSVTPITTGEHDLVFEIFAIDPEGGSVTPLRTFRDTVSVEVTGLSRAIAFADQANPLFVLLGGLGSAIAGLIGAVRFFGRGRS